MIDFLQLWVGVSVVYGEVVMDEIYGWLWLVFVECVVEVLDGYIVFLGNWLLLCIEMFGYVKYYIVIYDEKVNVCFIGDMFGFFYCELDIDKGVFIIFIILLVQFDLEVLYDLIDWLFVMKFEVMYFIYYGWVEQVECLVVELYLQIDVMLEFVCVVDGKLDWYEVFKVLLVDFYVSCVEVYGCL